MLRLAVFIIIALTAIVGLKGAPGISMMTGWDDKANVVNQRLAALGEARGDAYTRVGSAADETLADERSLSIDRVMMLYDSFEDGNILSMPTLQNVINFEEALVCLCRGFFRAAPSLSSPRPTPPTLYARSTSLPQVSMPTWKSACRLAYNSDGNSSCASGDTILNYLYTNASAHQVQHHSPSLPPTHLPLLTSRVRPSHLHERVRSSGPVRGGLLHGAGVSDVYVRSSTHHSHRPPAMPLHSL